MVTPAQRAAKTAYMRLYRAKNRQKVRDYQNAYKAKHRQRYPQHYRSYRLRNLEACRQRQRNASRKLKARVMLMYDGKCAYCGQDDLGQLCIDHRDGGGEADRKLYGSGAAFYRRLLKEPKRDDLCVACAGCNALKEFYRPAKPKRKVTAMDVMNGEGDAA
jgi:hypothetical protein